MNLTRLRLGFTTIVMAGLLLLSAVAFTGYMADNTDHIASKAAPEWLRGEFISSDKKLNVQFIDRPKVWYTRDGKFETLDWREEAERIFVTRPDKAGKPALVGMVKQGKQEGTILWIDKANRGNGLVLHYALRATHLRLKRSKSKRQRAAPEKGARKGVRPLLLAFYNDSGGLPRYPKMQEVEA